MKVIHANPSTGTALADERADSIEIAIDEVANVHHPASKNHSIYMYELLKMLKKTGAERS